jgi:hypothetical protein
MSPQSKAAYVAGFMDGEGTFCIGRTHYTRMGHTMPGEQDWQYRLMVQIPNTNKKILDWIKDHFGGIISKVKSREQYKQQWLWLASGNSVKESFILAILPYLIGKREQALVALAFLRLGSAQVPLKRNDFRNKMISLNDAGTRGAKPVETNTLNVGRRRPTKIEPDLTGDSKSDLAVMQVS